MGIVTVEAYKAAEQRAARTTARRGFQIHAAVTVAVSVVLVLVNVTVATAFPWSVFPVAGMGVGLLFHWYFGVLRVDDELRRHQDDVERQAAAA